MKDEFFLTCLYLCLQVFEHDRFFYYAKILVFTGLTSQMTPEIRRQHLKNAP